MPTSGSLAALDAALAAARAGGGFTVVHQRFWEAARRRLGDGLGTWALVEVLLSPTSSGSARLADLKHHAYQVQDELLAPLDAAERDQLRAMLAKVLNAHPAQPA